MLFRLVRLLQSRQISYLHDVKVGIVTSYNTSNYIISNLCCCYVQNTSYKSPSDQILHSPSTHSSGMENQSLVSFFF
ncbi:unnamed protein product, partial [Vitis vinifera]